jgi:hypothetical protein
MERRQPKQQRTYDLGETIRHLTSILKREQGTGRAGERTITICMDDKGRFTKCVHAPAPERVF